MDSSKKYYDLTIQAESSDTEIWLGTDDGHFVQKNCGEMRSSLLPVKHGHIRVIDESGGDYLYPTECFVDANLSEDIQRAVVRAA